jgi:hypothetical protein
MEVTMTMKKSLATISSGLVLALGLTAPAWAQLRGGLGATSRGEGDLGIGRSAISTSSTDRTGLDAREGQQRIVKGSTQASDNTKTQLKTKNKVKANANNSSRASANAKAKKQKGHKKNQQPLQTKSETNSTTQANADGKADARTGANLNSDAGAKVVGTASTQPGNNSTTTVDANSSTKLNPATGASVSANAREHTELR